MATDIPYEMISMFFSLIFTCWNANFCKFEDHFFEFSSEVSIPTGSPLGSLLSEILMAKLEKEFFTSPLSLLDYVIYWQRYVDDVLCICSGTRDEAVTILGALDPSITFTMEYGREKIAFLNLSMQSSDGDNFTSSLLNQLRPILRRSVSVSHTWTNFLI